VLKKLSSLLALRVPKSFSTLERADRVRNAGMELLPGSETRTAQFREKPFAF
jgi:hypothetical protein